MATTLLARRPVESSRIARSGRPGRRSPRGQQPCSGWPLVTQTRALPFDTARSLYARAVQAGLIERSLLANAEFERALGALERLTLGPWARRV